MKVSSTQASIGKLKCLFEADSGLIVSHVDFFKSNNSTINFCFEKSRLYLTAARQVAKALSSAVEFNSMVTFPKKIPFRL